MLLDKKLNGNKVWMNGKGGNMHVNTEHFAHLFIGFTSHVPHYFSQSKAIEFEYKMNGT